jgi:heme exporter protein C
MKPKNAKDWTRIMRWLHLASFTSFGALIYLTWFVAPDWAYSPDVTAPLTRKILFFHPASAWAAFAGYFIVFGASVTYLNERDARMDAPAQAAAEVAFLFNTIALLTGTFWGIQEWASSGESSLATVYSEPKVLVVLIMWFSLAAYLLLRKLTEDEGRRMRLAAIFGVLGFITVPLSFATSRVLQTSLHPDIAGPGKNPDAAVGDTVGAIIGFSMLVFLLLTISLWLERLRQLRINDKLLDYEAK